MSKCWKWQRRLYKHLKFSDPHKANWDSGQNARNFNFNEFQGSVSVWGPRHMLISSAQASSGHQADKLCTYLLWVTYNFFNMIYESYERDLAIVIIMIEVDSKNWRGQEIGSDLFVFMLRRFILVPLPLFRPLIMLLTSLGKMYVPLFVKILVCGSDKK